MNLRGPSAGKRLLERNFQTALIAICLCLSTPAHADFSGRVIRILDGDTIEVLNEQRPIRIRLADIDAPESGQAYGNRSRQYLASIIFPHSVTVKEKSFDRYGRLLADIMINVCSVAQNCTSVNVNAEMVRAGMAWAYRYRGRPTSRSMFDIEAEAKNARRGLWADPTAIEPWQWRRHKAKNYVSE